MVAEPSQTFSSQLTNELVIQLPDLLDSVRQRLSESPDYAGFLESNKDEVLRLSADAIRRLVDSVERQVNDGGPPLELPSVQGELFEVIGRVQFREGRELAQLLSAYQIGAHLAWRYVSSTALRMQLPLPMVTELAEAVFSFVDALTDATGQLSASLRR